MYKQLTAPKTYRYFCLGNPEKATTLLYVLHGYGQLSEYFIRKFDNLPDDVFIVAPEGMHRFYLNGNSGRVGASWMTKEDRASDIHDNQNWLSALDAQLTAEYTFTKKILLGFSQGGATATRWFYDGKLNAQHLIVWASVFPPDLALELQQTNQQHYFLVGSEDEYFDENQQAEQLHFYQSNGFKTIHYAGKHAIYPEIAASLIKTLKQ